MRHGCPSKKRRYKDELAAKIALASTRAVTRASTERGEKRIYPCPRCGGWHITSNNRGTYRPRGDQS